MQPLPLLLLFTAAVSLGHAAAIAVPDTPDTPFKLATIEVKGGRSTLALILDDKTALELPAAHQYVAKQAKLPPLTLPTDMRSLIEQYDSRKKRLYLIANFFRRRGTASLPFAHPVASVTFQAPIRYPWNLLAAAANYRAHAEGMGAVNRPTIGPPKPVPGGFNAAAAAQVVPDRDAPIFFAKSPRSCIIGPGEPYYIPAGRERIDWEGEMAIIIGKPAYQVAKDQAHDYVFGYSILHDLSDRGGRRREVTMFPGANWFEGKSTDRGAPFGPVIVPKEFLPNFDRLRIITKVNGVVKQDGSTAELIWKEHHIINYLTSILTLYPGDVISSGTPSGTGMERQEFLKPGDSVSIEIEGIGTLTTPIRSAAERPR